MLTTLLHQRHEELGARFAPFAGYDMPIQYPSGAVEEHRLTRRSVGLFDIDHMGQILVSGKGSGEALSSLVSNRILDMKPNQARYALLLSEDAGVLDDLFIYRAGPDAGKAPGMKSLLPPRSTIDFSDAWFVVVNASNREADYKRLRALLAPSISVLDLSDAAYMIAVQGPRAVELLDALSGGAVSATPRFSMTDASLAGVPALIGRTGYTGEDGAELFYPAARAVELWDALLKGAAERGIEAGPVGLAARDSLRFEAAMPLHGHEITASINPIEALLSWACDFDKEFIGKAALLKIKAAGPARKLVTLSVTGGVPREGYPVQDAQGRDLGACVAGMFCPTAGSYAANAFVPPDLAKPGTMLKVIIRGAPKDAVVVKRPLYIPAYRR